MFPGPSPSAWYTVGAQRFLNEEPHLQSPCVTSRDVTWRRIQRGSLAASLGTLSQSLRSQMRGGKGGEREGAQTGGARTWGVEGRILGRGGEDCGGEEGAARQRRDGGTREGARGEDAEWLTWAGVGTAGCRRRRCAATPRPEARTRERRVCTSPHSPRLACGGAARAAASSHILSGSCHSRSHHGPGLVAVRQPHSLARLPPALGPGWGGRR